MTEPKSLVVPDSHSKFTSSSQSIPCTDQEFQVTIQQKADDPLYEQFCCLVRNLSDELKRLRCSFEDFMRALQKLTVGNAIPILIPTQVKDISLLCTHLRKIKMCLESDVDLLSEIFKTMKQDKIEEMLTAYANEIAALDVVKHLPRQSDPTEQCFLMITVHDDSALTLGDAFDVKCSLSSMLHIQRYVFTLIGSESGPIGLIWQVPNNLLEQIKSNFIGVEDIRTKLMLEHHHVSSIKLKTQNSGSTVIYSRLAVSEHFSVEETSASHQESIVPFMTNAQQGGTTEQSNIIDSPDKDIGGGTNSNTAMIQDSDSHFTDLADKSILSYDHDSEAVELYQPSIQEGMHPQAYVPTMNPPDMNNSGKLNN